MTQVEVPLAVTLHELATHFETEHVCPSGQTMAVKFGVAVGAVVGAVVGAIVGPTVGAGVGTHPAPQVLLRYCWS
ncbi:MAG: hypothetical protein V1833_04065 [Elusimicrobiota bacterium]